MNIQTEAELRRELFAAMDILGTCLGVMASQMQPSHVKDSILNGIDKALDRIDACRTYIADNGAGNHRRWMCQRCGGEMEKGQAIAQTYTSGEPDFAGDSEGITMSAGGPGKLIPCLKCKQCGHSEHSIGLPDK